VFFFFFSVENLINKRRPKLRYVYKRRKRKIKNPIND